MTTLPPFMIPPSSSSSLALRNSLSLLFSPSPVYILSFTTTSSISLHLLIFSPPPSTSSHFLLHTSTIHAISSTFSFFPSSLSFHPFLYPRSLLHPSFFFLFSNSSPSLLLPFLQPRPEEAPQKSYGVKSLVKAVGLGAGRATEG